MSADARRSGLLGKRSCEALNELTIHARNPTVITTTASRSLDCATLTHGRGTKKNGTSRKRRYTDHRATISAWARYCIETNYITCKKTSCEGFLLRPYGLPYRLACSNAKASNTFALLASLRR